ncbi:MAG: hypothetical protein HY074_15080 [Deltaproteobacteria bacterium]|nr:hypothetical protein [Deltaproteobacteria bacterium]
MRNISMDFAIVLLLGVGLTSCGSTPTQNAQQQIMQPDHEAPLASRLDRNLMRVFGEWKDTPAERIPNAMINRIAEADSESAKELKGAHIRLLATATPYLAPGLGKAVYISRGALSAVLYENELAFLLAAQLACVRDHVTAHNLANLEGLPGTPASLPRNYLESGWFDAGGLFDFGSFTYLKAEQEGVKLMYAAKYDPRGAVTLVQRWTTPPFEVQMRALGKILPDSDERLVSAREEVAKLSPVRNPIVKSPAFEELQSRLVFKKAKTRKKSI